MTTVNNGFISSVVSSFHSMGFGEVLYLLLSCMYYTSVSREIFVTVSFQYINLSPPIHYLHYYACENLEHPKRFWVSCTIKCLSFTNITTTRTPSECSTVVPPSGRVWRAQCHGWCVGFSKSYVIWGNARTTSRTSGEGRRWVTCWQHPKGGEVC